MHGEYKVPGGKLVVIDLDVVDEHMQNIELSGDFFLEPDETLHSITEALDGLPVETTMDELSERVRAVVTNAELLGITPEGVAVAVRRALDGETQ